MSNLKPKSMRQIPLAHLEGLVALGMIKEIQVSNCDSSGRRRKIIARDVNGVFYETRCIDYRGLNKFMMFYNKYVKLSKDLIMGVDSEETQNKGDTKET